VDKHVAPLGHIILIPSKSVFALSLYCCVLTGEEIYNNNQSLTLVPGKEQQLLTHFVPGKVQQLLTHFVPGKVQQLLTHSCTWESTTITYKSE
jgi:hypothetical protein